MIKPHIVAGKQIKKELADKANALNLSESCVDHRIRRMHWTPEKACTTPSMAMEKKRDQIMRSWLSEDQTYQKGVKRYFMSREEIVAKYGPPGKVMYPERQKKYAGTHWGD
ncbi:hypothetical protein EWH99_10635 [Sporolactobacillus sp. THM7-7]|nr:hypothetical protein EWH99_10635 [Sporolactobacillus sp. THM7-7]